MSTKSHDKEKNKMCTRRWIKEGEEKFANINCGYYGELSKNYAMPLQKLALKNLSNKLVFECIKKTL